MANFFNHKIGPQFNWVDLVMFKATRTLISITKERKNAKILQNIVRNMIASCFTQNGKKKC